MPDDALYPYVLDPKLTTQVWGGDELVRVYGKHGDPNARYGESWECWDTDPVTNGTLQGSTRRRPARQRSARGCSAISIPDADLSRAHQDHHRARLALGAGASRRRLRAARRAPAVWKDRMLVRVRRASRTHRLVYGWTRDTSREEYERRVRDGTLTEILRNLTLKAGDTVYIPYGSVHAIGPGRHHLRNAAGQRSDVPNVRLESRRTRRQAARAPREKSRRRPLL